MFPIEILSKIAEIILGDVAKDVLGKGRDPKRKFARELFAFYDAAKEYKTWCVFLLDILEREKRLEPSRRMSWSTAYEAQKVSDNMTDLICDMVGRFQSELISQLELLDERYSRKASKRFRVIEVFDTQLASLIERALAVDLAIGLIAAAMSQQKFDEKTQNIIFLDPYSPEFLEVINHIDHEEARIRRASFVSSGYDLERRDIVKFFRTVKFTEDKDFELVSQLLHRSVSIIDDLTDSIAIFIKANYEVEELL